MHAVLARSGDAEHGCHVQDAGLCLQGWAAAPQPATSCPAASRTSACTAPPRLRIGPALRQAGTGERAALLGALCLHPQTCSTCAGAWRPTLRDEVIHSPSPFPLLLDLDPPPLPAPAPSASAPLSATARCSTGRLSSNAGRLSSCSGSARCRSAAVRWVAAAAATDVSVTVCRMWVEAAPGGRQQAGVVCARGNKLAEAAGSTPSLRQPQPAPSWVHN